MYKLLLKKYVKIMTLRKHMRRPDPYGWMVSDTVIIIFISIFSQLD